MFSAIQSANVLLPVDRLVGSGSMVRPWPTNQSPECNIERIEFLHFCIFAFLQYLAFGVI